jgi:hypothetical protein
MNSFWGSIKNKRRLCLHCPFLFPSQVDSFANYQLPTANSLFSLCSLWLCGENVLCYFLFFWLKNRDDRQREISSTGHPFKTLHVILYLTFDSRAATLASRSTVFSSNFSMRSRRSFSFLSSSVTEASLTILLSLLMLSFFCLLMVFLLFLVLVVSGISVSVGVSVSRGEKFFAPTICNL